MKNTLILGAMSLCLAAPTLASAASADVVIATNQHRYHRHHHRPAIVINEDGQRLHYRKHGREAFYDHGKRHWHGKRYWHRKHRSDDVVVIRRDDRPHRHRHVIIQN
jgi:hypothetical protein